MVENKTWGTVRPLWTMCTFFCLKYSFQVVSQLTHYKCSQYRVRVNVTIRYFNSTVDNGYWVIEGPFDPGNPDLQQPIGISCHCDTMEL